MDDIKGKHPDLQTCQICLENPVGTTFLPCGHLVGCDKCTCKLQKCPKCKKKVNLNKKKFLEDNSNSLQDASKADDCYRDREDRNNIIPDPETSDQTRPHSVISTNLLRPKYSLLSERLNSFAGWPESGGYSSEDLTQHGFSFTNYAGKETPSPSEQTGSPTTGASAATSKLETERSVKKAQDPKPLSPPALTDTVEKLVLEPKTSAMVRDIKSSATWSAGDSGSSGQQTTASVDDSGGTNGVKSSSKQKATGTKEILEAGLKVLSRWSTEGKVHRSIQRYCDNVVVDTDLNFEEKGSAGNDTWHLTFIVLFILLCCGLIHTSCNGLTYILSLSANIWYDLCMCFDKTDLLQADAWCRENNITQTTVKGIDASSPEHMMAQKSMHDVMSQLGYGVLVYLLFGNLKLLKLAKSFKHVSRELNKQYQDKGTLKYALSKETLHNLLSLRQISPVSVVAYPFQYSKVSNQCCSRNESMKNEWNRICSFGQHYTSNSYALSLAKHGFYYDSRSHAVRCFCCDVMIVDNGQTEMEIAELHRVKNPNCHHVARNDALSGNIPIATAPALTPGCSYTPVAGASGTSSQLSHQELLEEPMGRDSYVQDLQVPEPPNYQSFEDRLQSFTDWQHQIEPSPRSLAEAGFFYTGDGDKVECFSCGIGCFDWNNGENAWMEHAVANIDCAYLKQLKDSAFFRRARQEIAEREKERNRPKRRSRIAVPEQEIDPMATHTARVLMEMDMDPVLISQAVQFVWRELGGFKEDKELALNWILDKKEKDRSPGASSNSGIYVGSHMVSVTATAVRSSRSQDRQVATVAMATATFTTTSSTYPRSSSLTSATRSSGRDETAVKEYQPPRAVGQSHQPGERMTAANLPVINPTRSLPMNSIAGQQASIDQDRRMTEVAQKLMAMGYTFTEVYKELSWLQHNTDSSVQDIVQMAVISIKGKRTQSITSEGELLERQDMQSQIVRAGVLDVETQPEEILGQEMNNQQVMVDEVSGDEAVADVQMMSPAQNEPLSQSMDDQGMSIVEAPPVDQGMLMEERVDNEIPGSDEAAVGQAMTDDKIVTESSQNWMADEDQTAATNSNGSSNSPVATEGATGGHSNGQIDRSAVKKKRSKRSKRNNRQGQVHNYTSGGQHEVKDQEEQYSREQSLAIEENEKLREVTKCKVCLDSEVTITFLPCGHLVTCQVCSTMVQECPVCREPIRSRTKTYM